MVEFIDVVLDGIDDGELPEGWAQKLLDITTRMKDSDRGMEQVAVMME